MLQPQINQRMLYLRGTRSHGLCPVAMRVLVEYRLVMAMHALLLAVVTPVVASLVQYQVATVMSGEAPAVAAHEAAQRILEVIAVEPHLQDLRPAAVDMQAVLLGRSDLTRLQRRGVIQEALVAATEVAAAKLLMRVPATQDVERLLGTLPV